MQQTIKITFFAGLKDIFGESIELPINMPFKRETLFSLLTNIDQSGLNLLKHSRIATDVGFFQDDEEINETAIFLLPPVSGG